jgi:hypothetical protein
MDNVAPIRWYLNMNSKKTRKQDTFLGLFIAVCLSGGLLFVGLGDFGMWDPHEMDRADTVKKIGYNAPFQTPFLSGSLNLEERLSAVGSALDSHCELGLRFPVAILALVAVVALFLLLIPLCGLRITLYGVFAFASAPILLFHGRQLTSGMPLLFGEVLALGGLVLATYGKGNRSFVLGALTGLVGLVISGFSVGILRGVAVPFGTIFIALLLNGDVRLADERSDDLARRQWLIGVFTGLLAILSTGIYLAIALFSQSDFSLLMHGGLATSIEDKGFDFVLEQIAYGWFPWSAFVPVVIISYFTRIETPDELQPLRCVVIAGITTGCNPPTNDRFCPSANVTRGQMAAFLTRALDLPAGPTGVFSDDDDSEFEADIEALATAGITTGCNPPANDRFCPNDNVTRGQMAAFLNRGLNR